MKRLTATARKNYVNVTAHRPCVVYWEDAYTDESKNGLAEFVHQIGVINATCGFLVHQDRKHIVLAEILSTEEGEWHADFGNKAVIPKSLVRKIVTFSCKPYANGKRSA
jgi:hypothetical protein